jgi:hypothetical protein
MGDAQAKDHQHHTADAGDHRCGPAEQHAQRAAQRTQRHEDQREAGHQGHGVRKGEPAADFALRVRARHGGAGQIAQIDRHQRQHAGGKERHQAEQHRQQQAQILEVHSLTIARPMRRLRHGG